MSSSSGQTVALQMKDTDTVCTEQGENTVNIRCIVTRHDHKHPLERPVTPLPLHTKGGLDK